MLVPLLSFTATLILSAVAFYSRQPSLVHMRSSSLCLASQFHLISFLSSSAVQFTGHVLGLLGFNLHV
jgi:hypothetical protein